MTTVRFWAWYLRGTWAIARHGGGPGLVLSDIAAGIRWWWARHGPAAT
jgi:hypothetical protein